MDKYDQKTNKLIKVKNKKNFSFVRNVALPFSSGIAGAALVVGLCVGVSPIRELLANNLSIQTASTPVASATTVSNINTSQISLSDYSDTSVGVATKVLPSVVGIEVEYTVNSIFSKNSGSATAEGSGVIISEDGYILTNNHVISSSSNSSYYELGNATSIKVYLYNDETPYTATIVGKDEQSDLAVIKIEKDGLTAAELGDSSTIQVGEWCMAIGNPLGMKSSVTTGTISAVNREVTEEDGQILKVIQTCAAINSGNSGGALVNSQGQVIGINTMKASGTGIEGVGFAIPINTTKSIYSDLINYSKVKRAYLGITGIDITDEVIKSNPKLNLVKGIYIKAIEDFSSAEKGGLQVTDIITKVDNKDLSSIQELKEYVQSKSIGDSIEITYVRDSKTKTTKIILQEQ